MLHNDMNTKSDPIFSCREDDARTTSKAGRNAHDGNCLVANEDLKIGGERSTFLWCPICLAVKTFAAFLNSALRFSKSPFSA